MKDLGTKYTDKQIKDLEERIHKIYKEAEKDLDKKIEDFTKKYEAKEDIHQKELEEGKITQQDFDAWKSGQVFQGKQWQSKKDQITKTLYNANQVAVKMTNNDMYGVFAFNSNYQAYQIESSFGINFGFGLYDSATVTNLIKNDPQILPKWKIDEEKDYKWNAKKVNNAIVQGIIQGEKLNQIAKRLSTSLCAQNENTMKTFARTGMTQAQNAGRNQRLADAEKLGINMTKEWMATLDSHTRDSHADIDGEKVKISEKFSNGCRYPGDPEGPAREVYNCRCTLVADLVDYPSEYKRYDNIDGKPVENMTYREWEKAKKSVTSKPVSVKEQIAAIHQYQQVSFEGITQEEKDAIIDYINSNPDVTETVSRGMQVNQSIIDKWISDGEFKLNDMSSWSTDSSVSSRFANVTRKVDAEDGMRSVIIVSENGLPNSASLPRTNAYSESEILTLTKDFEIINYRIQRTITGTGNASPTQIIIFVKPKNRL